MAEERAVRLAHALANTEARAVTLEAEIESTALQLEEVKRKQRAPLRASSSSDQQHTTISITRNNQELSGISLTTPGTTPLADSAAGNSTQVSSGPWYTYLVSYGSGLTNFVRIEGTSSIHNWQVESRVITGTAQLGTGFQDNIVAQAHSEPLDAKINVSIPVRSLKSVDANGRPYSDRMDEIMYDKLRLVTYSRITYSLSSLTPREQPGDTSTAFLYDATGQLGIAGKTNTITMPVSITLTADGRIQFAGSVQIRMSDFQITPPAPSFDGIAIKTGDEVRLSFAWGIKPATTISAMR